MIPTPIKNLENYRVLVLGSFHQCYKTEIKKIRDDLIKLGLINTRLISDFDLPLRQYGENQSVYFLRKCVYWISQADVYVLLFLTGPDNSSVAIELTEIVKLNDVDWRTILALYSYPPMLVEGLGRTHKVLLSISTFYDTLPDLVFGQIKGSLNKLNQRLLIRGAGHWETYPAR